LHRIKNKQINNS